MKSDQVRRCAVCGKPETPEYRPFCSRRCANLDLQRWFSGAYAVPAAEGETTPGGDGEDQDV
jgi:endogenous inhibitor of DNA gyrase (YacG/DUF329 family)